MINTLKIAVLIACASISTAQAKTVTHTNSTTANSISIEAPVDAVQPDAGTFTLTVPTASTTTDTNGAPQVTWTRKKTTVVTDAGTTFDGLGGVKDIHPGTSVSVSGSRRADGAVLAASVSLGTDHNASSHVSVMSVTSQVKSIDAANNTFMLPTVETHNTVGVNGNVSTTTTHKTVTVLVTPQTKFQGLSGLADIHVGDTVSATGDTQPDGTLRASRVSRSSL
ncbi:MAG: DUF5666 domain-containing protein [Armatimonadota bacterium]|nr:DUF5666 domain-containing protein [Armatimonadota bacterium]